MNNLSTIDCPHFGPCSGCTLNDQVLDPPIWTYIQETLAQWSVPHVKPLYTSAITGWRIRAKLAVRGSFSAPKIGLFQSNSHTIHPIPHCRIHHPAINQLTRQLIPLLIAHKVAPYDESAHRGSLRYIQTTVQLHTNTIQLALVHHEPLPQPLLDALQSNPLIHSLYTNHNPLKTNTIFGPSWTHRFGPATLVQHLHHLPIHFHPGAFIQAHWTLFSTLAASLVSHIPSDHPLLELYAGAGALSLLAAPKVPLIHLYETNPYSHLSFLASAPPPHLHYHPAPAAHNLPNATILVDPPRKGLDSNLLASLSAASGTLLYLSCNFHTLAKDADYLIQSGWRPTHAEGYLLFPGTDHVETLLIFKK